LIGIELAAVNGSQATVGLRHARTAAVKLCRPPFMDSRLNPAQSSAAHVKQPRFHRQNEIDSYLMIYQVKHRQHAQLQMRNSPRNSPRRLAPTKWINVRS
jgi:hypothetical protein